MRSSTLRPGARHRVGAPDELQARGGESALEAVEGERNRFLHGGEAFVVVVADALVLRAILQIVAEDQAALGIVVRPALGHELQHPVGGEDPVFDLGAARLGGGEDRLRAVGVDQGAESLGLRLRAHRFELGVGHGLRAALADALRGEDLDDVGALGFAGPDQGAKLIRRAGTLGQGLERGEDPRPHDHPAADGVAKVLVLGLSPGSEGW